MVVIHCAYTEAINPSGSSPVLSRDQIWRGLQRKIRKAQDFVPVIEATDVLEEKENEVIRVAHFKAMNGHEAHSEKEICKSYYPTKVRGVAIMKGWHALFLLVTQQSTGTCMLTEQRRSTFGNPMAPSSPTPSPTALP